MKLSICMMVKNESRWLEKCLQSLQPLREHLESELIIVDTGSTDNTVEIAQRFTDKLYFHEWNNDFSAMRNITIQYATGEWVLIIDGDEILEKAEEMIAFLKSKESQGHNAGAMYVKNFTTEYDWSNFSTILSVRLFKKFDGFRYEGAVHNQPVYEGPVIGLSSVLLHYGYLATDAELMERKFQRTSAILKSELEKNPNDIYYLYQLSVSYGMHKDYPNALPYALKAYDLCKQADVNQRQYMYVYTQLAVVYLILKQYKEAEAICKESIAIRDGYIDIYHYMAEAQFMQGKHEESIENYNKYLSMVENYNSLDKDSSVIDYTLGKTDQAYFNLCGAWKNLNNDVEALACIEKVNNHKLLEGSIPRVIDLTLTLKEYSRLKEYYQSRICQQNPAYVAFFQEHLEQLKNELPDLEQQEVVIAFKDVEGDYGLYNKLRYVAMQQEKLDETLIQQLQSMDFSQKPAFYGELLYLLLKNQASLVPLLRTYSEALVNTLFGYLASNYPELPQHIVAYLKTYEQPMSFNELKLRKTLSRYVVMLSGPETTDYQYALPVYVHSGMDEIQRVYQPAFINGKNMADTTNKEHSFFLYMYWANQYAQAREKEPFKACVQQAIATFPHMEQHVQNFFLGKKELLEPVQESTSAQAHNGKCRVAFFVKEGMDAFLGDVLAGLDAEYELKKIIVTQSNQIVEGMQWADICWFEWCDELIGYASQLPMAQHKKIICRLHSYEAFTDYPEAVQWKNVDQLICDVPHIRDIVLEKVPELAEKTVLIPVGVDMERFSYKKRKKGFNVAYVGYINYKKGPMLLLQLLQALVKKDARYKLHVCGEFQDQRYFLYFKQMIQELGLTENFAYNGRVESVNDWLEDKDYIVSTSLLEGQHLTVMEGMCKGIKPIVHNFVGAKNIYDKRYIWNSVDEAVAMIAERKYDSAEYRNYIELNYSNTKQEAKIIDVLNFLEGKAFDSQPLITIAIINYNYARFLDRCVQSISEQTHKNIDVLIIDDCSTDDSIEKIKQYENSYPFVRAIYHEKNSGSAVLATQEAIKYAKGSYLMTLSADDYLADNQVLRVCMQTFREDNDLDYVYGKLNVVDVNEQPKDIWQYEELSPEDVVFQTFARGGSGVLPITTGVYRTSFFRENQLTWVDDPENRVAGDTLNSLVYLKYQIKYRYISRALIAYRHHNENMTYDIKGRIKSIISVLEYIISNFNETVYLRSVNWAEYKTAETWQAAKNYYIAQHYLQLLEHYGNANFSIWEGANITVAEDAIREYVKPLAEKAKWYIDLSINSGDVFVEEGKKLQVRVVKYLVD